MDIIQKLEQEEMARVSAGKTIPTFGPGDTVIVSVNVVDGTRKRVLAFEGVVSVAAIAVSTRRSSFARCRAGKAWSARSSSIRRRSPRSR